MKFLSLSSIICLVITTTLSCNSLLFVVADISRSSFPDGFIFGAGASAYQFEGAAHGDGKQPSIWDTFVKEHPEKIVDHSTGDVADDFYHRFEKDVALMKEIGLDTYRFSLSWPRILPTGKVSGGINQQGVDFYNFLIDQLLWNGIEPFVTIFHWDVPQALEDEYLGFLSPKIIDDFQDFTDLCFQMFGDRVKYWTTINEPNMFSYEGYALGEDAPGRCSDYIGKCEAGNSATEPYIVTHNLILSHAAAVKLYRDKYKDSQKGIIGFVVNAFWFVPKYPDTASEKAASRALQFDFDWIMAPIINGEYPKIMTELVGDRLPKFTKAEEEIVKGSFDYIGINYYTSMYAEDMTSYSSVNLSYTTDSRATLSYTRDGIPIGQPTECDWLYIYPQGLLEILQYTKRKYGNLTIYVTENGMADNSTLPHTNPLDDKLRVQYHLLHLSTILEAMREGVDVRGYLIWSFLDDFEWSFGYTLRFGINYIDYKNGLTRRPKNSAIWYKRFLHYHNLSNVGPFLLYEE